MGISFIFLVKYKASFQFKYCLGIGKTNLLGCLLIIIIRECLVVKVSNVLVRIHSWMVVNI
jgi:hypothetical protein